MNNSSDYENNIGEQNSGNIFENTEVSRRLMILLDKTDGQNKQPNIADSSQMKQKGCVASFVMKLYGLLEDPCNRRYLRWNENGDVFMIFHAEEFAKEIFPKYFKHSKFPSFVRQLNIYGFYRVTDIRKSIHVRNKKACVFSHSMFLRGRKDLLPKIRRRVMKKSFANSEGAQSAAQNKFKGRISETTDTDAVVNAESYDDSLCPDYDLPAQQEDQALGEYDFCYMPALKPYEQCKVPDISPAAEVQKYQKKYYQLPNEYSDTSGTPINNFQLSGQGSSDHIPRSSEISTKSNFWYERPKVKPLPNKLDTHNRLFCLQGPPDRIFSENISMSRQYDRPREFYSQNIQAQRTMEWPFPDEIQDRGVEPCTQIPIDSYPEVNAFRPMIQGTQRSGEKERVLNPGSDKLYIQTQDLHSPRESRGPINISLPNELYSSSFIDRYDKKIPDQNQFQMHSSAPVQQLSAFRNFGKSFSFARKSNSPIENCVPDIMEFKSQW